MTTQSSDQLQLGNALQLTDIFAHVKSIIISAYCGIVLGEEIRLEKYRIANEIRENSGAIYFYKTRAFGVEYLKSKGIYRIIFPAKYSRLIDQSMVCSLDFSKGFSSINITDESGLHHLDKVIIEIFEASTSKDIGCCSSYVSCSDALRCINNNPEIFLHCAYRKNLQKGNIFYGKNKNV